MPLAFRTDDQGILPDRMIAALAQAGGIVARPSSHPTRSARDLTCALGEWRFCARRFLPARARLVAERIDGPEAARERARRRRRAGDRCVYIVPLQESMALPPRRGGRQPKSSTGRIDVFTRVIADQTRGFDRIEAGYHGPLYAEISPRTFSGAGARGLAPVPDPLPARPRFARRPGARRLHARERLVDDQRPTCATA